MTRVGQGVPAWIDAHPGAPRAGWWCGPDGWEFVGGEPRRLDHFPAVSGVYQRLDSVSPERMGAATTVDHAVEAIARAVSLNGVFVGVMLSTALPAANLPATWNAFTFNTLGALLDWYREIAGAPGLYVYIAAFDKTDPRWTQWRDGIAIASAIGNPASAPVAMSGRRPRRRRAGSDDTRRASRGGRWWDGGDGPVWVESDINFLTMNNPPGPLDRLPPPPGAERWRPLHWREMRRSERGR